MPTPSSSRFAPARDPNLAAATSKVSTSTSTTLLPSGISRLPQNNATGLRRPTISGASKKSASPVTGLTKRNSALSKIKPSSPTSSPAIPHSTFSYSQINSEDSPKSPLQGRALYRQDGQRSPSTLSNKGEHDQASMTSESQQETNEETDEDDIDDNKSETDQEEEEEDYNNDPSRTQSTQSNRPVLEKEDIVKTTSTTSKTPSNQAPTYGSLAANLPVSKSEQVVPLKDYEELRLKLKILEAKRQEDREKYREHEKVKEEAEQFLTLRNKLQGTLICYIWFFSNIYLLL